MVRAQDYMNMSLEDLWRHQDYITRAIQLQVSTRLREMDDRLKQIERRQAPPERPAARPIKPPYPRVRAKYRNPDNPSQTWSGRGYRPIWLAALLAKGRALDEFLATSPGPDRRVNAAGR